MSDLAYSMPPILREGDRLTTAEFLRRWDAMPDLKQAELISGTVFMASPVARPHAYYISIVTTWLGGYHLETPGTEIGSDGTWIMAEGEVPQPDLTLRILPECGGQSRNEGRYFGGAPELAIEVSDASTSRDLGVKLELYRKHGVREYLSIILGSKEVIWRILDSGGRYRTLRPDTDGLLRSQVFPGLWLRPDAIWNREISILSPLNDGLRSEEHAHFVRTLHGAGSA